MRTLLSIAIGRPLSVVGLLAALLAGARPASAQPAGLALQLTASHARIAPGGTLRLDIGAFNQGAPVPMDVYCVVVLPDGATLLSLSGVGLVHGRLDRLAAIPPLVANATLPTGFATTLDDFFTYTFTGAEPGGTYRFLLAAVRPGALADGRVDGGDLLALANREVTFGPPLTTTVDPGRAGSTTVTPLEGGTVTTTAADGSVYTLTVPAGAVAAPTTVTLTPVLELAGLGQPVSLVAGLRAEPSGLQFAQPARLFIDVPVSVPPTALAALVISGGGTGTELVPVATGARRLTVQLPHFSEVVIPIEPLTGDAGYYAEALRLFHFATLDPSPLRVQLLVAHLEHWFDSHLSVLLSSGQTDEDALVTAIEEFTSWDLLRVAVEREFGTVSVGAGPARGVLTGRGVDGRMRAATGVASAFSRNNDRCLAGTAVAARLADAETAAAFALLARQFFDTLATNQGLSPTAVQVASPDLAAHGLDEASVGARICVKPRLVDVVEPTLNPGQSGVLRVVAGVSFGGGPVVFTSTLGVRRCSDPAAGVGCGEYLPTNTAGQVTFPVTANASGRVRYSVCAQIATPRQVTFYGLFLAFAAANPVPCRSSVGGVVVSPPQTTIAPGASRQFTAVVEDSSIQEVTWTVSGGGTISATGLFTSNGTPGTYFVTATSVADPESVGIAQVTVTGSGGSGEEGPCPRGCSFPGTFTFCHEGTCNDPSLGNVTAHTFRPLPTDGHSGALSWVCSGSLITAEITRSAGNFAGVLTRSSASCRDVGSTVNVPITGSLSASSLSFVVNLRGTTTTLTFASTAAAVSSREKR